jgi:hypothetical protein
MPSIKNVAALFFAITLTACLPGADGSNGTSGTNGANGANGANGENGGGGNNGGNEPDPIPYCYIGCTSAGDCADIETGAFGSNNYACTNGSCEYTGCGNDDACAETFGATGDTYLCRDVYNTGTAFCQKACGSVAECVPAAPGYEEANFSCTEGVCKYEGCTTDNQCETRYASSEGNWGCRELNGHTDCRQLCTADTDCGVTGGQEAWDSDNYTCNAQGFCEYQGCNSDAECNTGNVTGQVCQVP